MPPKTPPSLLAVARLAGVSTATVSRALSGHPLLNPATIGRIRAIATRVGYRANPLLSDLMRRVRQRGRLHNLGTIAYLTFHDSATGWRTNPTYRDFHEGARRRASELGFEIELIWAREPNLRARRLSHILRSRNIAGVIVGPRPAPITPDIVDWSQLAAAVVGMPCAGLPLHRAGSHHLNNMEKLLAALSDRGYRRPGLALLPIQAHAVDRGWLAAWEYFQHSLPLSRRVPRLNLKAPAERTFVRWYRRHRPDVVIGLEDDLIEWLERLGRHVPKDVGFARLSRPLDTGSPAGIHQCPVAIGAAAVDLVVNQVLSQERGLPLVPRTLLIEGQWMDGWTARTAPGSPARETKV
jgi:LacI family transcriptional regulator